MTLSQQFQDTLLTTCQEAQTQVGCPMTRLMQTITTRGGLETAQDLIRRGRLSDGFDKLEKTGLLSLSLEAVVVQPRFGELFSDDEVNACYAVLLEGGYYG